MSPSLLDALLDFGRAVRAEGLPVTTGQIEELVRALGWTGIEDRETVFRVARALLISRREHLEPFREIFDRFWSPPGEAAGGDGPRTMPRAPRHRPREGFTVATYMAFKAGPEAEEMDVADRSGTFTAEEALRRKRFAEMTPEELEAVRRLLRELRWDAAMRVTRRRVADDAGRHLDLRRVLARAARRGSIPPRLPRRRREVKPRPVVLLADISGSMEKYARLVLTFFHSVAATLPTVETFVFGTRLNRITPELRRRDIDVALDEVSRMVTDWAGGTRIGPCLRAFNREWSRRVLRRGAVVVIVSDGCDRDDPGSLAREMRYVQHRCHRLVWLNPYLGHARYEPRAAGMQAALPYIDDFLPADDVQSLEELARFLRRLPAMGATPRRVGGGSRRHGPVSPRRGQTRARDATKGAGVGFSTGTERGQEARRQPLPQRPSQ